MPPSLTTNNELWDAYRKKISQVIEWLKNMLAMRGNRAVCGNDPTMNIIPHVDAMYQEYATEILEVGVVDRVVSFVFLPRNISLPMLLFQQASN